MQTTQKAGDPSMDEILASIRKIIADDPVAPASSAQQPPAQSVAKSASPVSATSMSAVASGKSDRKAPSTLEQDLADLLREPIDSPRPSQAAASPLAGPLPIIAPSTTTVAPAVPVALADAGDKGAVTGLGGWLRNRPNGAATAAAGAPAVEPAGAMPSQEGRAAAMPPMAAPAPGGVPVAPAANGSAAPVSMQSILSRLNVGAVAATDVLPTPPGGGTRVFSGDAKPSDALIEQPASAPANRPPVDASSVPVPVPVDKPMEPLIAAMAGTVPAPAPIEVPAASPAVEATMVAQAPLPVAKPQKQELLVPGLPDAAAPPIASGATGDASMAAGGTEKSLDDTLAELLRPVVRQWLDENMARALEKAVKIEMADSVKSAMSKLVPGAKS